MAGQPRVDFEESVTSDTSAPAPSPRTLRMDGKEFLAAQPYRSGAVGAVVELARTSTTTTIGLALPAENIFGELTTDRAGRLVRERLTTPNHLIERRFRYPTTR